MRTEVTVHVDAQPKTVYELISDVTGMGEWSPECVRCEWMGRATGPAVGARLRGHNRRGVLRWSTTAEVVAAEPGREFAFVTRDRRGRDLTRWGYRFQPSPEGGTDVTESCEVVRYEAVLKVFAPLRSRMPKIEQGMRTTLERVKAAAERA